MNTPALRALFNNLGSKLPVLALEIDAAIRSSLMADWRETLKSLALRHEVWTY